MTFDTMYTGEMIFNRRCILESYVMHLFVMYQALDTSLLSCEVTILGPYSMEVEGEDLVFMQCL